MGRPHVGGEIDPGGPGLQQLVRHLVRVTDGQGETGGLLGVFIPHSGVEGQGPPLRRGHPLLAEGGQGLAAQVVQGGQGEGQALLHPGGGHLAGEGGAAGAGELALHLLPGEGHVPGRFGHRALHPGHMALPVLHRHLGGLVRADHGVHAHGLLPVLPVFIGGPGLGVQLPGLFPLLTHAEHVRPLPVQIIALGKALAGEGLLQLLQLLRRGLPVFPQGPGVDAGDDGHILGPLHPALQL